MPTRRMIDPSFWQSESLAVLTRDQRLLFIGLFSNADDQGRLKGHPAIIRSTVFPFDDISIEEVENDLKALVSAGCIIFYELNNKRIIQIINWWKYQQPQWAYPSEFPPPESWQDRLRYRKNNEVLTDNWDHNGGYSDYPEDDDDHHELDEIGETIDNALPKPLPKALPKPIVVSSSNSININQEEEEYGVLCKLHETEFGFLSPLIAERLKDLQGHYPHDWILLAYQRAVLQNVRKIAYLEGILKNWQTIGGPQNDKPPPPRNGASNGHSRVNSQRASTFKRVVYRASGPGPPAQQPATIPGDGNGSTDGGLSR